ncbi:MAG: hypothetical protein ACE5F1_13095 [Planctomycetota bacterium]
MRRLRSVGLEKPQILGDELRGIALGLESRAGFLGFGVHLSGVGDPVSCSRVRLYCISG